MAIDWSSILTAIIPAALAGTLAYLFGRRERDKRIDSSIVDDVQKITDIQEAILKNSEEYWRKRFEDHEKDCNEAKDRLRNDLASALVDKSNLEKELANKKGYIEGIGITNPLVKLEASQTAALRAVRKTDK